MNGNDKNTNLGNDNSPGMANDSNDLNNQLNIQNNQMIDDPNNVQIDPQVNNQVPPVADPNKVNSKDNTPNDQSPPSTSVFGNKSSPHSIFDTIEEESSKDNQTPPMVPAQNQTQVEVPQTPDSIQNQNEINMNSTINDNEVFNGTVNSTSTNDDIKGTVNSTSTNDDINGVVNPTNTTVNNVSVFEANIEEDNKNETLVQQFTNSTNYTNTNIENKIVSFNESLANNLLNNSTNKTEINRLAQNIHNKSSIFQDVHSNKTQNKTKMNLIKRNRDQLNSCSINTTESIDQDKQERIKRFYKAYLEKKKELLKKLKEKNQPPIFKVNEIGR